MFLPSRPRCEILIVRVINKWSNIYSGISHFKNIFKIFIKMKKILLIYTIFSVVTLFILFHHFLYIPVLIIGGAFIIFKALISSYIGLKTKTGLLLCVYIGFFYIAATHLHLNFVILFIVNIFFIKLFYYFYEVATYDTPLKEYTFTDFVLYFFFFPFLLIMPVPISYHAFIKSLTPKMNKRVLWRGIKLILLGTFLFSAHYIVTTTFFYKVTLFSYIIQNYTLMSSIELFAFLSVNFILFFCWLAGSVHITVGILNMCGFDLYPGFHYVFISQNLLEFWRRWHIYFREFLVSTIFYPVSFYFVRHGRKYGGVFIAGLLTFIGASFVHLVPLLASIKLSWDIIIGVIVCDNSIGIVVALMLVYERAKFEHPVVHKFSNAITAITSKGKTNKLWQFCGICITLSAIIITDVFRCVVMEGAPFYESISILKHLFGI